MNKTTIAHMIIERLAKQNGIILTFPTKVKGDLEKEHDWAMSVSGFNLINNFRDIFDEVCNEIDDQVASGEVIFTDMGIIIGTKHV